MRPPRRGAQKKWDEPPQPPSSWPCGGKQRCSGVPEIRGPREPTHVARTTAADTHPSGEPGWGAGPPPPLTENKALGERCEILLPFPLLHRWVLRLRPRCLSRRGGSWGACGRVCRQGLSWDPSITWGLALTSCGGEQKAFLTLCHLPPPHRVKCGTGIRRKASWPAAGILTLKMTWFRVSDQTERQLGSNRIPRTLFLPLPPLAAKPLIPLQLPA